MKARLLLVFVLVVGLVALFTWAVEAQRPTPTPPRPGIKTPTPVPPSDGPSLQVFPPPILDWDMDSREHRPPLLARRPRVSRRAERPTTLTLGSPGTTFRYVQTFGETGVPYSETTTHLNFPYGVVADGTNVWIADSFGRRALKFTNTGSYVTKIGAAGVALTTDVSGILYLIGWIADIGVDSGGNIWLVDTDANHVLKFSSNGNYLGELGVGRVPGSDNSHFRYPAGIAFDNAGNIYVSDGAPRWDNSGNQRIQIFNSAGNYLNTINVTNTVGANFNGLHHITIDSNNRLYVADTYNHRVQVFNVSNPSSISYVGTIGSGPGSGAYQFNKPLGVAVDANYIYVADGDNHRVQIYDRNTWSYVATIGSGPGSGNSQFNTPADVAIDSLGNIYVADFNNTRVQQFNSSRAYVRTYGTTGVPYVTDNYHYNLPRGVAVASDGSIYIAEQYGHRLVKLNAAGTSQWTVGRAGIKGSDNNHFNTPQDVVVDAVGRVYVADTWNHRIQIFNSNGTYNSTFGSWGTGSYNFDCPEGLTIAPNGYLYVADTCNHRVQVYDSNRAYVATLGVTGSSGSDNAHFNRPEDVVVDSNGTIYVSERENHRVQVFNANRNYVRTIGVTGVYDQEFDYLYMPHHLAVDARNNLYLDDHYNDRFLVFDQAGAFLTAIAGSFGSRTGQLRNPFGVAVDQSGNVFLADWDNHRIQKFAPGVPNWVQSNLNGFGTVWNKRVLSLTPFGGQLYAGTYNIHCYSDGCYTQGAQIWRQSSSWTRAMAGGFGDALNVGVNALISFNSQLYAGTAHAANGGQVWRSSNGTTWSQVVSNGFDKPTNGEVVRLAVFNNQIYATTWSYSNGHGAEIWRSPTGSSGSWSRVVSNGFNNDVNTKGIPAMTAFGGYLYAGKFTWVSNGAEIWRSNTGDSGSWVPVATNGFNGSGNTAIASLAEFNGYLYAGTRNWTTGGQIWRCSSCDSNSSWSQVVGNGFGKTANGRIETLIVSNNSLHAVTYNGTTGAEVWRTANGTNWEQVGFAGFGSSNNHATYFGNSAAVFTNQLFIGTLLNAYANGAGIWATIPPVYLPLVIRDYPSSPGWVTITSMDFEGSFPGLWQVFDNNGTNYGEYYWAKRTCRPYAGSYSGWAVGGGTNGAVLPCGSNYPNNASSWMVYGPFSLVGATASDLKFKLWLNSESGYDYVGASASINGTNFYGTGWSGSSGGWIDRTLDLTNVYTLGNLMGQPNVWIALFFYSDGSVVYPEGAYVDNIVLRKCPTGGSCPAGSAPPPRSTGRLVEIPMELMLCRGNTPCPQPKMLEQPKK